MKPAVSLLLQCAIDDKDTLLAELYGYGTTGIVEKEELGGDCTLEAFFDTQEQARDVATLLEAYRPIFLQREERDYIQEFEGHWQPLLIGHRFWLAPPWHPGPPPPRRLRVNYQPGMACGSGVHPCTQLCLAALEDVVMPGASVADIGAGSGILLLAAKSLGASLLAGCDVDFDSVVIAKQAVPEAMLFHGSADSLRPARFDAVIANISSETVESLLPGLRQLTASSGKLVLSGFRLEEMPRGLGGIAVRRQDGWACVIYES